ncbi:hypothetical protein ACFVVC_01660 [Pseudarthrobacter sp. NPDC058196]|uniref:hypothetical protein n=1 Tax=Pseudarthrobacter sp. NPDC058196 TaxID=3346376 RepID=UPI0036DFA335
MSSEIQLHFVDPASGNEIAPVRSFTGRPGYTMEACTPNTVLPVLERIRRNFFSPDLTMVADSRTTSQITHIGYDPEGQAFVDLSPAKATNYSAKTPRQIHPSFNLADRRLWFYDETTGHLGSVDPRLGPSSIRQEQDPPGGALSDMSFEFDNHGKPFYTDPSAITSLDGQWEVLNDAAEGWKIAPKQQTHSANAWAPVQPDSSVTAPTCEPGTFIDDLRFICWGGNNIYVMTLTPDRKSMSQTTLLPPSDNRVQHVLPSPDGSSVAFLSGSTLYVTSSTNQQEPRKVVAFQGQDIRLVGWQ